MKEAAMVCLQEQHAAVLAVGALLAQAMAGLKMQLEACMGVFKCNARNATGWTAHCNAQVKASLLKL